MANFDCAENECQLKGELCCLEKSSNDVLTGFWCDLLRKSLIYFTSSEDGFGIE